MEDSDEICDSFLGPGASDELPHSIHPDTSRARSEGRL